MAAPTVNKLKLDTKAAILAAMPEGPSRELLDKIDDVDKHAIDDIFGRVFMLVGKDKIPASAQELSVLTHALWLRLQELEFDIGHHQRFACTRLRASILQACQFLCGSWLD